MTMLTMHEEILASSELYDSFPRYKMSDYNTRYSSGSIPSIVIPQSKYSSTETELSSDDHEDSGGCNGGDNVRRLTVSGFSTSASSSGSSRRRRRRRRKGTSSNGSTTGVGGLSSSLTLSIKSNMSGMSQRSSLSSQMGGNGNERRRNSSVPVLNSINDLNHAIGRHRGISGSFTPAVDATLFAMFYATDIFDGILKDGLSLIPMKYDSSNSYALRKDVTSVLRKEIVYSLRTSYFCPASKIVKLTRLLEEHFPLEQFHEPASFLDLVLSKILRICHPPFLTYSNGLTGYVHRLPLEERPHLKRSYFHPPVLSIQQLLQRHLGGHNNSSSSPRKFVGGGEGNLKFVTVPYPALILQLARKSQTQDDDDNHPGWTSRPNFPIIPNMEVDLTGFISKNSSGSSSTWNLSGQGHREVDDPFYQSFNESITSYYPASSDNSFSGEGDVRSRVGTASESRLVKGLKSAWKSVFNYLENLTPSSSDFTAQQHHEAIISSLTNSSNNNTGYTGTETTNSPFSLENNDRYKSISSYNSRGRINHRQSSSSLPSTSFHQQQRYDYDLHHARNELEGSFSISGNNARQKKQQHHQDQPQVRMELIAIICYAGAGADSGNKMRHLNGRNGNISVSSPYYVYCKAGNDYRRHDNGVNGYLNTEEFAPWILYQSRYGVAPQVTLIENFGKWISSLERNHEEFSLYEVPLEIRRVLENSDILIYKRVI